MDMREAKAELLIRRGEATIDELLEVSFGEWPPRGLDIVHENAQRVSLTTSLMDYFNKIGDPHPSRERFEFLKQAGGMANTVKEWTIYINEPLLKAYNQDRVVTLGHEATHILQDIHFHYVDKIMGKDGIKASRKRGDYISNIAVQEAIKRQWKPKIGLLSRIFNKAARDDAQIELYLKEGVEVQARLSEALIAGYPSWARLPQNRAEFFFCMKSVGFCLPATILDTMKTHPDRVKLGMAFPGKNHFSTRYSFVEDIEDIESNLTEQGRENLWAEAMPRLYAMVIGLGASVWGWG